MNRRQFLGRLAAIAGAATLVGGGKQVEAALIGTGPNANWYIEQGERGLWQIIDQRMGEVYAGPLTDEMLDALQHADRAEAPDLSDWQTTEVMLTDDRVTWLRDLKT